MTKVKKMKKQKRDPVVTGLILCAMEEIPAERPNLTRRSARQLATQIVNNYADDNTRAACWEHHFSQIMYMVPLDARNVEY
jgi:hypothetical protein